MLKFPSVPSLKMLSSPDVKYAFLKKRVIFLRLLMWHAFRLVVLALIIGAWWILASVGATELALAANSNSTDSMPQSLERRVLSDLPLLTEHDVASFSLSPLVAPRKPLPDTQFFNQQEVTFCLLLKAEALPYDDRISQVCEANLPQSAQSFLQVRIEPYKTLLSFLKAFRFKNESNLTDYEYERAFSVSANRASGRAFLTNLRHQDSPPLGSTLSDAQNQQCFILEREYTHLKTLVSLGYPLKLANVVVELYNQHCSGRLSAAGVDLDDERFLSTKIQLAELSAMLVLDTVEFVQPQTCLVPNASTPQEVLFAMQELMWKKNPQISFVYPFEGTAKQQNTELVEMQQRLIELGYFQGPILDSFNESVLQALENFAHELNLVEASEPAFTTLLYLRLFTVGFQPSLFKNPVSQLL